MPTSHLHRVFRFVSLPLFGVALFFFANTVSAATISVCAQGCAATTVQQAVDAVPATLSESYTIEIRDSRVYNESVRVSGKKTSVTKILTIRSSADASPTLFASESGAALQLRSQQFVTIEGLHFSGEFRDKSGAISLERSDGTTIRDNTFVRFSRASIISINGGKQQTIEGNTFRENTYASGISFNRNKADNTVRNNTFMNLSRGIFFETQGAGGIIENNTFLLDGSTNIAFKVPSRANFASSRIDRNEYYLARGATLAQTDDATYATLAEWQAAGFDEHATLLSTPPASFVPWRTIQRSVCTSGCDATTIVDAVAAIPDLIAENASIVITVRDAGPYDGGIRIGVRTDPDHTVTITAAAGISPIIRQASYQNGFYIRYADYITIRGFTFPGVERTNFHGGAIMVEGSHNTIEGNTIENTPKAPAIALHGGEDNRVLGNAIRNVSRGVAMYYFSRGHFIRGNTIADAANGVSMDDYTEHIRIEQNTLFNVSRGVDIGGKRAECRNTQQAVVSCDYVVRNNIIVTRGSESASIVAASAASRASLDTDYQLFSLREGSIVARIAGTDYATLADWQQESKDTHSIAGDPLFANDTSAPYDFHLKSKGGRFTGSDFVRDAAHSPAIDAGDPATSVGEESTSNGGRINIGSYGGTREASRSVEVILPPSLPPAEPRDRREASFVDTSDDDWRSATTQSTVVVGGGAGASIALVESNAAWQSVTLPTRTLTSSVAFMSSNRGVAVGEGGTAFLWDGATWSTVATPTSENLWGVAAVDTTRAFAVGNSGTIIRFDGQRFEAMSSPISEDLMSVSAGSGSSVFAVGSAGKAIRFDGINWQRTITPTSEILYGVHTVRADRAWAVGGNGTFLSWNGATWSTVATPTTQALFSVYERSDGSVFVVGDGGFVARYTNGAWTTITSGTTEALLSITFVADGRGWIVGDHGTVRTSTDGLSWETVAVPTTEALFATAAADGVQWVMGTNGAAFSSRRFAVSQGTLYSRVYDAASSPEWTSITVVGTLPGNATARLQIATSTTADGPWEFVGPDGTPASFFTMGESILPTARFSTHRYARYTLTLVRASDGRTPSIEEVRIRYTYDASATPLAPTPIGPREDELVRTGIFVWSSVPDADRYEIAIASDASFVTRTDELKNIRETTAAIPVRLSDGRYFWRVRAVRQSGESAWSATQTFIRDQTAPTPPTLREPLDGSTRSFVTDFSWSEVLDASAYDIQIATADDFRSPLIDQRGVFRTSFTMGFAPADGAYSWRVRARDRAGNESAWAAAKFTIAPPTAAPTIAPTLHTPLGDAFVASRPVLFEWSEILAATRVTIEVSTSPLFIDQVAERRGDSAALTRFDWGATEASDGLYFWRVRGENDGGNGPWSGVASFTLGMIAPAVPELRSPESGETLTDLDTPTFRWDPVDNAVFYEIEVDTSPRFSTGAKQKATVPLVEHRFANVFDSGTYFWRVRSKDAAKNTSEWSSITSFTLVKNEVISSPDLVSPREGAVVVAPLTLSWSSISGARQYDVELAKHADFGAADLVFSRTHDAPKTTATVTASDLVSGAERYFWRVRVTTARGTSGFSSPRTFAIDRMAPAAPRPAAPRDGEVVQSATVGLLWDAPADLDIAGYHVQVYRRPAEGASTLIRNETVQGQVQLLTVTLPGEGVYEWRIAAVDVTGNVGAESVATFTVRIPVDVPELLFPTDRETIDGKKIVFQWRAVIGGEGYVFEVYSTNGENVATESLASATELRWEAPQDGTYLWRVRATIDGNPGAWSGSRIFTTRVLRERAVDVRRLILSEHASFTYAERNTECSLIAQEDKKLCSSDGMFRVAPQEGLRQPKIVVVGKEVVQQVPKARGEERKHKEGPREITTTILGTLGKTYKVLNVTQENAQVEFSYPKTFSNEVIRQGHSIKLLVLDATEGQWRVVDGAVLDQELGKVAFTLTEDGIYTIGIVTTQHTYPGASNAASTIKQNNVTPMRVP